MKGIRMLVRNGSDEFLAPATCWAPAWRMSPQPDTLIGDMENPNASWAYIVHVWAVQDVSFEANLMVHDGGRRTRSEG